VSLCLPSASGSGSKVEVASELKYHNTSMSLQEYLPGTRPVAVNELAVVHYLMGGQLPAQKWLAAVSPLTDRLPVVPLLGGRLDGRQRCSSALHCSATAGSAAGVSINMVSSLSLPDSVPDIDINKSLSSHFIVRPHVPGCFEAGISPMARQKSASANYLQHQKLLALCLLLTHLLHAFPRLGYFEAGISPDGAAVVPDVRPGKQATLWLAFKWEGMQPLALYAATPQQAQPFFWVRRGGAPDRLKMLRCPPRIRFPILICYQISLQQCAVM
jgi:hypothetical protein